MTKDEAIKWLKVESSYIEENVGHGKEILEAYDMAIKALEQESILDKIKTEVERMIPCSKEALSIKLGVLEILDEYKAESEE